MTININDRKSGKGEKSKEVTGEQKRPEGVTRPVGATLHFSSLEELKELFSPYFKILESRVYKKSGIGGDNTWNYFLMEN